jgi:ABC-type lipoprotein export system ATPase subunit
MLISIKNLIPAPLQEAVHKRESNVWNQMVDFDTKKTYLLYAPSGKGKSTFIHTIYGLRDDYQGEVWFDQQNIKKMRQRQWAVFRQQNLSIVFQDLRLFLNLTAYENILVRSNLFKKDVREEILHLTQRLGISHVLHNPVSTLSYGERQRTSLIRAVIAPFEFLLLDEPFSHLDDHNIEVAGKLIQEKCAEYQAGYLMTMSFDYKLIL